uniref:CD226 antigen isoform X1 n=1 Tax=Pogona vitticeps TaxID=103695 RepID=A0A6J0TXG3_9SAUR
MWPGNSRNLQDFLTHVAIALLEMDCLAFLTVAVLLSCTSCIFVPLEGKHVDSTMKLARDMTLECVYPKIGRIIQMSWRKENNSSKEKIAVFRLPYDLSIANGYKTRVRISNNTTNNKSLIFNNADEEDTGFYLCSFHAFPHGIWEKQIQVVQSDDSKSQVFLDPDVTADSQVTKPRRNVTIMCWHDSDITVNQVIWERVQVDRVDFIGQCLESGLQVYGSDYEGHVQIDCATEEYSTLVLWNVSASDAGLYHCSCFGANGKNESGWTKLTITGNVPLISMQHIVFIAGASAILIIITLASVVAIAYHKRKKNKNKRINMMKIFYAQRSHNCGCQHKANVNRRQNMASSGETQDEIYENVKCS